MMTVSHVPRDDMRHPHGKPIASDDMSDVTPTTRGNGSLKDYGMVSKVLKFRFKAISGKNDTLVAPSMIHTHCIDAIQETFGTDVEIITNKSQKLERIDLLQLSNNPLHHSKQFAIHKKTTGKNANQKTTAYLLHRIQTNENITNIKNAPKGATLKIDKFFSSIDIFT